MVGTLLLVRHGQASYEDANYDRLSMSGELQAKRLGEHLGVRGETFDAVYSGPRVRHVRTCAIAGEASAAAGAPWPTPTVLEDLDEMDAAPLFRRLPEIMAKHPNMATDRAFGHAMDLWMRGQLVEAGAETWGAFCSRVVRALEIMREGPRGRRVLVFTSGGPITALVRLALNVPPEAAYEVMRVIRNASISEFLFSRERFNLASFNSTPHLDDAALLTYR